MPRRKQRCRKHSWFSHRSEDFPFRKEKWCENCGVHFDRDVHDPARVELLAMWKRLAVARGALAQAQMDLLNVAEGNQRATIPAIEAIQKAMKETTCRYPK